MTIPTPPLPPRPDELETQIGEMTAWRGEAPELWRKAMEKMEAAGGARESWFRRLVARPIPRPAMAALLLVIVGVFAVLMVPRLGGERDSRRASAHWAQSNSEEGKLVLGRGASGELRTHALTEPPAKLSNSLVTNVGGAAVSIPDGSDGVAAFKRSLASEPGVFILHDSANNQVLVRPPVSDPADRQVVRKATIELASDDVRGTFAKAAHLVSEAGGEYVEGSSVTGEGKTAQATLTLRVAASRLGAVMAALGELGTVKSENTMGEDVTAQVVDLEARVRNEQRVEQELLKLLEKRADAPLKDILELRSSLASVRDSIERMIGQRERLGRLVSLASVLVVIRTADEPVKGPEKSGMGAYFSKAVAGSWRNGLEFLADTVAAGVALVVGGLVWWAMLGVVVYGVMRWRRRLAARCV